MCHSYSSLLKSKITFLDPLLQNFQKPENGMNGKETTEITTTMMRYPWTAKVPLLHPVILYLMLMKWTCLYHWMISLVKEKLREVFGTSVIVTQTIIYYNLKKSSTMTW